MHVLWSFLFLILLGAGQCSYYLKHLSYTKLPATFTAPDQKTYKMFAGTAEEAAYDHINKMLYVVGETSGLLHVLDISDPTNPQEVFTYAFNPGVDGKPRDVAVCGNEVAIALSSPIRDVHEGHIYYFYAMAKGDTQLTRAEPAVPVGSMPDMIAFTSNCGSLLVANEGRPGKTFSGAFHDPEGAVHIITRQKTGNPASQFVGFTKFNGRHDIRTPGKFTTNANYHPTVAESLEPEYIAISADDRTAYITLQENDAIATLDMSTGLITDVKPLEKKNWRSLSIDASDRDGGVHLQQFPFRSVRQPDVAKVVTIGRKKFVITVDEGALTSYTNTEHGFTWSDFKKADSLQQANVFDQAAINNNTFYADLGIDRKAGFLTVSIIDDIDLYNHNNDKLQGVTHFGGRGFSIWDATDFNLVWDSGDKIEREMDILLHNVFNTDCRSNQILNESPESMRDASSGNQGPKLNAMDILMQNNGDNLLLVGSETVGALFLYTLNTTSGKPIPHFETAHREGKTDYLWNDMYKDGVVGDVYISAIGWREASKVSFMWENGLTEVRIMDTFRLLSITYNEVSCHRLIQPSDTDPSFNRTLAYVVGAVSGSVSLYEIVQHVDPDNIFG